MVRAEHQPAIEGLFFDHAGRLVVQVTTESGARFDFHDPEGRAEDTVRVPERDTNVAPYFRGDQIAQVVRDSLDLQFVQLLKRVR